MVQLSRILAFFCRRNRCRRGTKPVRVGGSPTQGSSAVIHFARYGSCM